MTRTLVGLAIVAVGFAHCHAVAAPPMGMAAMNGLDQLAELRQGVRTYQASSYQRNGGNYDRGQFVGVDGTEHVMLDVAGAGCVYRIWMTGIVSSDRIRIYFDGQAIPTVDMAMGDFFSGTVDPFLAPLCVNDDISSGGFICYLPMEFATGCRITTTNNNQYYNITYQLYADATGVTSFDGTADSAAARDAWDHVGQDPSVDQGAVELAGTSDVAAGATLTLADIADAGVIQQLELTIPGLEAYTTITQDVADDGRAHLGYSEFVAAIDPANTGVELTRRLDFGIADQTADVYVDGSLVGQWSTAGGVAGYWLDDTFAIPGSFTSGKSAITIKVVFVSSANDWNEFYYWVDSIVGGEPVLTDELDVGDTADETAHSYVISGQAWEGQNTLPYYDGSVVPITDDGRATRDWVEFDMTIDPNNAGVELTRRLDFTIADQKADVYVDGVLAGEWLTQGFSPNRFVHDTFDIDAAYTAGKSSITIKVDFVSSSNDWNEFYYWAHSIVGGAPVLTDELDVGDTADESAHSYTMQSPVWYGVRTFELFEDNASALAEILMQARLVMTWDEAPAPQVDVPLGSLFGSNLGPVGVAAWANGMIDDRMYCWLPMPFGSRAEIAIVNDSAEDLADLGYAVRYTPMRSYNFAGMGYFYAKYNETKPMPWGEDFIMLDETGAGHFIGVVQTSEGDGLGYLEGDERIYVDGSLTPQLYGTGTEDFYNGGWYFNRGRFSLPTHGNPTMGGSPIRTDMYRYMISDLIPFTTSIKVGIEHGPMNDTTGTNMWSVALYYKQAEPLAALTDTLDVGDATSEAAHSWSHAGLTWTGTNTYQYEGDDNDVDVMDDGRSVTGGCSFTVAVDPNNAGVLLRRRLDYGLADQMAEVRVDGTLVGTWYDAGNNTVNRFRDSEFMLPASVTAGKATLSIELTDTGASDWSLYHVWVYSLQPVAAPPLCGDANCDGLVDTYDIDAFVAALVSDQGAWEATYSCDFFGANDINDDGFVDTYDIDGFVAALVFGACQ